MSNEVTNILSSPIIKASLILKNATSEHWAENNPILFKGELGIETDTNLLKIGDGKTPYIDLPYVNIPMNSLSELLTSNMPVASEENPGGVRGSALNNSISIDENGIMTINKISVSKLVTDDGEDFIISGGTSNTV